MTPKILSVAALEEEANKGQVVRSSVGAPPKKPRSKRMKFDELLFSHLGEMGRYQKLQFLLVTIPTMLCAMYALSWTFAAYSVPHRCELPDETSKEYFTADDRLTVNLDDCFDKANQMKVSREFAGQPNIMCYYDQCTYGNDSEPETCSSWVYDHSKLAYTAIEKWDIVCDRGWIKATIQAFYYVGQMAGSIIFGILGDKIGRKKVFFIAIVIQMSAGALMAVVPTWWLYAIFRAATGFAHPGIFVIAVVIGMELVGPSHRRLAGVISGVFFSIGQVLLGSLAYFVTDYRILHLSISVPALVFLSYWWIVPESARWLVSQKKYEEADAVLQRAARMNGVTLPDKWWELLDKDSESSSSTPQKKASIKECPKSAKIDPDNGTWPNCLPENNSDLLATPKMRVRSLTVFYLWPVVSMVYYGLAMKSDVLGGDLYVSFIMGALIEMPALFIVFLLIDRIGRRFVLAGGFFIAGFCLISNLLLPTDVNKWIAIAQLMITKGSITAVYATIYTFSPELFPTVVRNTAMGLCSTIARVGAISASYVAMWIVESFGKVFMIIPFGTMSVLAGILTLCLLPETMGTSLPETIAEVEGTEDELERELQPLSKETKEPDS